MIVEPPIEFGGDPDISDRLAPRSKVMIPADRVKVTGFVFCISDRRIFVVRAPCFGLRPINRDFFEGGSADDLSRLSAKVCWLETVWLCQLRFPPTVLINAYRARCGQSVLSEGGFDACVPYCVLR